MASLNVNNSITINAPSTKVWDALVDPSQTKQYMFGCETVSDWDKDSELLWRGEYQGEQVIFVKGTILDIQPGKKLVYTAIDPNSAIDDVAENYLTVTYELIPQGDQTILNVTQGDYNIVADGERRYKEAWNNGEGWNPILVQIKQLVEKAS